MLGIASVLLLRLREKRKKSAVVGAQFPKFDIAAFVGMSIGGRGRCRFSGAQLHTFFGLNAAGLLLAGHQAFCVQWTMNQGVATVPMLGN